VSRRFGSDRDGARLDGADNAGILRPAGAGRLAPGSRAVSTHRVRGSVRAHLASLERASRRYGSGQTETKLVLLAWFRRTRLKSKSDVAQFHQQLLFLRAFPDNPRILAEVERQLHSFARRVRALPRAGRAALGDTGIVNTRSRHRFDAPIVEWLVKRFPGQVAIDWPQLTKPDGLEFLVRLGLSSAETDGFDSVAVTVRAWLRRAGGISEETDLERLLRILWRERRNAARWLAIWDQAAVPIAWDLKDFGGSVTGARLPATSICYRTTGPRPPPKQPKRLIATPMARIELFSPQRARHVIDMTRAALTARCREVYAITHANADEVHFADLGEGASVAIIGTRPEMRFSLEANYGFLLLANGVPVGYGGVTPLFRQANTGIYVFDAFRGSEAAMLWTQTLRAFRTLFGVNRFIISPYQFGAGNSEAISSGAYWFYYRLGFRPVRRDSRVLAAREFAHLQRSRKHRTDTATLRRLAHGNLEVALPGARAAERFDEEWLERLGLRVTDRLARAGVRGRSEAVLWDQLRRTLGMSGNDAGWREPGPRCLGPLISLVENLASWRPSARAALTALLNAKSAPQELGFVREAQHSVRLFASLAALARRPYTTHPRDR
jgi:hypothetical protein